MTNCDGNCEVCPAYLDYNCEEWFSYNYQEEVEENNNETD